MPTALESRPALPKKLAARLRAAYAKLAEVRLAIAHGEAEVSYLRAYLAYAEADPAEFAEKHYPGHSIESYPVQTHLSRERERLAYRESRVPQRYAELPAAEDAVATVERQVLEQVARMRTNTTGREPWPKAPSALASLRKAAMKHRMQGLQKYLKHVAQSSEDRKRQEAQRQAKLKASMVDTERMWAATLAAMPPDKAAVYGTFWNAVRDSLKEGMLQPQNLSAMGSGLDAAIQVALANTRRAFGEDPAQEP